MNAPDFTPGSIAYVGSEVALIAPGERGGCCQAHAEWALGEPAVAVFVPAAAITRGGPLLRHSCAAGAEAEHNVRGVGGEVVLIAPDDHGGRQSHAEWALGEPVIAVFIPAAALAPEPVA